MATTFSWLDVLKWILLLLGPGIVGLWLLISGLRGRRVGDAPHCRACGYNLTGLTSDRCPECGGTVSPDSMVIGVRCRSGRRIVAGVFLLLFATGIFIVGAVSISGRINLYQYKPTFLVLRDAGSSSDSVAIKAYCELENRVQNAKLGDGQMRTIATRALTAYSQPVPRKKVDPYIGDLLYALHGRNMLTESQEKQFFDNIVSLELQVRSISLLADGIPYRMSASPRLNRASIKCNIAFSNIVPADQPVAADRNSHVTLSGNGSVGWTDDVVRVSQAGEQPVHGNAVIKFYAGSRSTAVYATTSGASQNPPMFQSTRSVSAKARVLATEPSDYFRLVTDSSLEDAVRKSFAAREIECEPFQGKARLQADIEITTPPVAVDFDVSFSAESRQYAATSGSSVHQGNVVTRNYNAECDRADLKEMDIILTPNPERARRTVDLTEIWGKPIRIEKVPVVSRGNASSQSASRNVLR